MKKILLLLFTIPFVVGCEPPEKVSYSDIIIDKYERSERDNVATWLWGQPMNKQVYYFKLEKYGEKSVSKSEYSSYKIGDTFIWQE